MDKDSDPEITTIQELLDILKGSFNSDDIILFRGQRADWELMPKLGRINLQSGNTLLQTEKNMMESLKLRSFSLIENRPETEWDWLSVAQHYGMATRLLDWTTNPLAALWFAVEKPAIRSAPGTQNVKDPGVIWAFKPVEGDYVTDPNLSPYQIKRTQAFRPKHLNRRITVQSGWFTAHAYLDKKNNFLPLDYNKNYRKRLIRINVKPDYFADLRQDLDRFDVNETSLFADLGGLCRNIQWQHSRIKDEF